LDEAKEKISIRAVAWILAYSSQDNWEIQQQIIDITTQAINEKFGGLFPPYLVCLKYLLKLEDGFSAQRVSSFTLNSLAGGANDGQADHHDEEQRTVPD